MKVFVTGASGFIGSALVQELLDNGHEVLGLARNDRGAAILEALGAQVHRGSIDDLDSLTRGAALCDGVAHLAFKNDEMHEYERVNAEDRAAITALAAALKGTNKPLVVTSGTLMLARGKLGYEDDGPDFSSPVSSARGKSEGLTLGFAKEGVRACVVRLPPTNHGEGDHGFITMMIKNARKTGTAAYVGNGENRWPAVHRKDTARVFRLILEKGVAGSVYHAVSEEGVPMKDIVTAIGKKLDLPVTSLPMEKAEGHFGFLMFAMAADNPTSAAKTREQLGWTPAFPLLLEDVESSAYPTE